MASKKIYYNDEPDQNEGMSELQIFKNDKGGLFVSLLNSKSAEGGEYVALSKETAIELISELAFEFDLIDDDFDNGGRMMWTGDPR